MVDTHATTAVVSREDEQLVLVDHLDRPIGQLDKSSCHDGEGLLHRAFSVFVFDPAGRVLLQQRAEGKRLWPGYWSNSCCSHPRVGEALDEALDRRVAEELGLMVPLVELFKFSYSARFGDLGSERELCSVHVGRSDTDPSVNRNEIAAWRWLAPEALNAEMEARPDHFTPWLKIEWRRLMADHADTLATLRAPV